MKTNTIEYTSDNGYKGVLYGESSFAIYEVESGECKLHTGFRTINTYDELVKQVENFPSFYESLGKLHDDLFNKRKETRIYISGAITNDPNYKAHFFWANNDLLSDGYQSIINPALVNSMLPKDFTHEEYMKVCIAMLECCDAIYMLDGWENSKGANIEYQYAKDNGLDICYESEERSV